MATVWQEAVPVVIVRSGCMPSERTFTGYSAQVEDSGAIVIFQVEPDRFDSAKIKRKPHGHTLALASGMWEEVESVWEPVGEAGLETP